ncbi:MAG: APC family permease [Salinibacter sp.]|uniref:APC family permease n=1 Tax=Salinibacter sp. TaxID=2065818 RepID=UPI0035D40662
MTTPDRTPVKVGLVTAASLVVANMIGTGIFTSVGFQVKYLDSSFALLMLWAVGGGLALCGALVYGELGAALPRSGGEYHLISELYHPSLGFIVGWITATLGFAGPIALAAIAFGDYTTAVFPSLSSVHLAAGIVVLCSAIHATSITWGSRFQNAFTGLKVLLILVFVASALQANPSHTISIVPDAKGLAEIVSPGFAVSLVFVTYAYAGWNGAVYIVGEIRDPQRNMPRSLVLGTGLVTVLYLLLTFVFLYTVPASEMAGEVEVGYLSGKVIFGDIGGQVMSLFIALLLVSTVSAMVYLGPRVTQAMGEDSRPLRWLAVTNDRGIPVNSILFQMALSLAFIYTSTFEQVLIYAGFTLTLSMILTVAGVFVLRWRMPHVERPYTTWGYPVPPLVFLAVNTWILVYVFIDKPTESLVGLGIVGVGALLYLVSRWLIFDEASPEEAPAESSS